MSAAGGFATGKYAVAICDQCGFKVPYLDRSREEETRLLNCPDCGCDEPQPRRPMKVDRQALRDPRPEIED